MAGGAARRLMIRAALGLAELGRTRYAANGLDLRSGEPRARPVVMIWALGADLNAARFLADLEAFQARADVVVVIDGLDFQPLTERRCIVETLPPPTTRTKLPAQDWPRYIERRIARIRAAWRPDLEIEAGPAPAAYLAELGPAPESKPPAGSAPTDDANAPG